MPNFYAEMIDGEKIEVQGDDIASFNRKTLFSGKEVKLIKIDFAGNSAQADFINKSMTINGEISNFEFSKEVKPVFFKRVREELREGSRKSGIVFYGLGWETVGKDEELSNTKICALDGHGLFKIMNKR